MVLGGGGGAILAGSQTWFQSLLFKDFLSFGLASFGRENGANFNDQYDTQYENHTTDSSIGERQLNPSKLFRIVLKIALKPWMCCL